MDLQANSWFGRVVLLVIAEGPGAYERAFFGSLHAEERCAEQMVRCWEKGGGNDFGPPPMGVRPEYMGNYAAAQSSALIGRVPVS